MVTLRTVQLLVASLWLSLVFPQVGLLSAGINPGRMNKALTPPDKQSLAASLKNADVTVRLRSIYAVRGHLTKAHLPILAEALSDPDWEVSKEAALTLADFGTEAIPFLLKAARSRDEVTRNAVDRGFSILGPLAASSEPQLRALLSHEHAEVRETAMQCLYYVQNAECVPYLLAHLENEDNEDCRNLIFHLCGELEDAAAAAVPVLVKEIRHQREFNVLIPHPAFYIAKIGVGSGSALGKIANDDSLPTDVREAAVRNLALVAPDYAEERAEAVRLLMHVLDSPQESLRLEILRTLAKYGPSAMKALPKLKGIFGTASSRKERLIAASAMHSIRPESLDFPGIVLRSLLDSEKDVRKLAVDMAAELKPTRADFVVPLTKMLTDSEAHTRWAAARTLRRMGRMGLSAIPALTKVSQTDRDMQVSNEARDAVFALERLRSLPRMLALLEQEVQTKSDFLYRTKNVIVEFGLEAVPYMSTIAQDRTKSESLRMTAIELLGTIGRFEKLSTREVLSVLNNVLVHGPARVQTTALQVLDYIGSDARPLMPTIEALLSHASEPVRLAAISALIRIDPSNSIGSNALAAYLEATNRESSLKGLERITVRDFAVGRIIRDVMVRNPRLVQAVVTKLKHADPKVRERAAEEIWHLAIPDAEVLRILSAMAFQDEVYQVRWQVRGAYAACHRALIRERLKNARNRS